MNRGSMEFDWTLGATGGTPAIVEPGRGVMSYADLNGLADRVAVRLRQRGVTPGSRVGIYLRRSSDAIAAMLGTLRAGCTYVPLDPRAPVDRIATILADCRVGATFVEDRFATGCHAALSRNGSSDVALLPVGSVGVGAGLHRWLDTDDSPATPIPAAGDGSPESACILYTSGSTGRPKGWIMSRNAIDAHTSWVTTFLNASSADVFANHAQFSFGMSLFDIYSSLRCAARLVLVPDEVRQHGERVVALLAEQHVSIWFSGPAVLGLVAEVDRLDSRELSSLRVVAFAGEVFPLRMLNTLRRRLPHPRYFNFWGSTETNVALHYELPSAGDLEHPPPIGRPCSHYEARVVDHDGQAVDPGQPGELQLRGVGLTSGYWKQPQLTDARLCAAVDGGGPWVRTGDLARELPSGALQYVGRLGRMVKLRGYRIEPAEIEARLHEHPSVREVGVAPMESASGLTLVAHVSTIRGERLPLVEMKQFCAQTLPAYMIPERFEFHDRLPRTSSGKIDLQALRATAVPG